jgi:hypothetical protein
MTRERFKRLLATGLLALALGIMSFGSVGAQEGTPPGDTEPPPPTDDYPTQLKTATGKATPSGLRGLQTAASRMR